VGLTRDTIMSGEVSSIVYDGLPLSKHVVFWSGYKGIGLRGCYGG